VSAAERWRRLATALACRSTLPPLVPEQPWDGCPDLEEARLGPEATPALWLAAAVIADRPAEALAEEASDREALLWRAIALRRTGAFSEARQAFRSVGVRAESPLLLEHALAVLRRGGAGFRWASEAAAHLAARGTWDPIWFVDACAAAHSGLLSRETAALLEEIQRDELELLLGAGAASQS
jgi:hypothetical protein